jgi:Stigma-specific protein, Stig1
MEHRNTIIMLFASFALFGCDPKREQRPCMNMGNPGALVSDAELIRIDVYGASVHCDGASVPAGIGAPDMSRTFTRGQKVQLDVPPGHHTFVLTTFSDGAASIPLGEGCTESDVPAGSLLCFDPSLRPVAACKTSADCALAHGGAIATPVCDPVTHRCVQCLTSSECGGGGGGACCGNRCVNITTDKANCGVCGMACEGAGVCCSGGCASLDTDFHNCGMCGQACSANHVTPSCSTGSCEGASCSASFVDCNHDKRTDGCECPGNGCCGGNKCQNQHDNGVGGAYYDCDPLRTYDSGHATAAALSANPNGSPSAASCSGTAPDGGVPTETQDVICSRLPSGNCACWTFHATGASTMWIGYVGISNNSDCYCPSPGGNNHPWN